MQSIRWTAAVACFVTAASLSLAPLADRPAHALDPAKAPGFRVKTLDGQKVELKTLLERGPVLLDFWATWCKPCHQALPELQAWHEKYGPQGVTVLGISVDGPRNHNKVRPFVVSKGLSYPIALDEDGRLQQLYHVVALPTAVLIDTAGVVSHVRVGFRPGESQSLEDRILALLGVPATSDSAAAPADTSAAPVRDEGR